MANEILLPQIPLHVLAKIGSEGVVIPGITKRQSVLLYTDISGFTALTETLTQEGKEGIEEVTSILNDHFGRLSRIIANYKGILLKLGGDSLLASFSGKDAVDRGTKAAWEMLDWFKENPTVKTKRGDFTLSMKAILGGGEYYEAILGSEEKTDWFPLGITIEELAYAEKTLGPGELVVKRGLNDIIFPEEEYPEFKEEERVRLAEQTRSFLPLGRSGKTTLSRGGEYRVAASCFLNVDGYDCQNPHFESLNNFYLDIYRLVKSHKGTINKIDISTSGNKYLILFGAPLSHETDRSDAARCFKELSEMKSPFRLTAGLSYGAVFAGYIGGSEKEYTVIGQRVNSAAKIMAASQPGEFVITDEASEKFADIYETEELLSVEVRGIKHKRFRLTGAKTQVSGLKAEWTTHSDELKKVLELAAQESLTAGITGDQGIGKSRFLQRATKELTSTHEVIKLSLEEREAPYQVFRRILVLASQIKEEDDPLTKRLKLKEHLESIGGDNAGDDRGRELTKRFPFIAAMLFGLEEEQAKIASYSPELRLENLLDAFRSYLLARSAGGNLALVVDDLSKTDSGSFEMLSFAARTLPRLKPKGIFFLFAYDKEYEQVFKDVFVSEGKAKEIILSPLSASESRDLTELFLGAKASDRLHQFLYERALGNPTVLEQWIGYLTDKGFISKKDETWEMEGDVDFKEIPDDLYSLVFSRLDRLSENVREALKLGAVYGMHFPAPIISNILGIENLGELLNPAVSAGLVYTLEAGEVDYVFNQTLIRDVCYDSILRGERERYHNQVARAIENLYKSSLERYSAILAHHFTESGDWENAFTYSIRSAKENRRLFRNEAAEQDFAKSVNIWQEHFGEGHSEDLYTAYFGLGQVYEYQGRFVEAAKQYSSARNLSIRTGMQEREVDTLNKLAYVSRFLADFDHLFEYSEEAMRKSETLGYKKGMAVAHIERGAGYARQGRHEEAEVDFQTGLEAAQVIGDIEETNRALNNLATLNRFLGQPDKSLDYYQKAVALAEKSDDKLLLTTNILNLARLLLQLGKTQEAESYLERALKAAIEIGHRENIIKCTIELAGVYLMKGDLDTAYSRMEEATIRAEELQNPELSGEVDLNKGHIFYYMGKPEEALESYKSALRLRKMVGEPQRIADAHAHVGNTLQILGKLDEAMPHLEEAYRIFSELGNPQGSAKALATLASTNRNSGRFKEGFSQIKEARELFKSSGDIWGEVEASMRYAEASLDFALYEEALQTLDYVEDVSGSPEMTRLKIEALILRANTYAEMGLLEKGLNAAGKAVELAKRYETQDLLMSAIAARIYNLIESKDLETAVVDLMDLQGLSNQLENTASSTTSLLTAVRINLANGMFASAIQILLQVEKDVGDKMAARECLSTYLLLSEAYYGEGKMDEAQSYALKVIEAAVESDLLWFSLSANLILSRVAGKSLLFKKNEQGTMTPSFSSRVMHPIDFSRWTKYENQAAKAADVILEKLSKENAALVRNNLIERGIDSHRLTLEDK